MEKKIIFIYFNSAKRLSKKKKESLQKAVVSTIAVKMNLSFSDFSILSKDINSKEINTEHKKSIKLKYPHIAIYKDLKSLVPICLGICFCKK